MHGTKTSQPLKLDHRMFTEVHHGLQQTLSNMFGVEPKPQPFSVGRFTKTNGDISSVINLMQEKAEGLLILTFPRSTIVPVFSRLYQEEFHELNQSIADGVGEIANVTFGIVKTSLNKAGFALQRTIPEIVIGNYRPVAKKVVLEAMTIPYTCQFGAFEAQVIVYVPEH